MAGGQWLVVSQYRGRGLLMDSLRYLRSSILHARSHQLATRHRPLATSSSRRLLHAAADVHADRGAGRAAHQPRGFPERHQVCLRARRDRRRQFDFEASCESTRRSSSTPSRPSATAAARHTCRCYSLERPSGRPRRDESAACSFTLIRRFLTHSTSKHRRFGGRIDGRAGFAPRR
jgi:hypothetical protein